MRIKEYFKSKPVFSLEIFPPKPGSPLDGVLATIAALSDLRPDFISVTYGAAGGSRSHTVEIADTIKNKYGIEALPTWPVSTRPGKVASGRWPAEARPLGDAGRPAAPIKETTAASRFAYASA